MGCKTCLEKTFNIEVGPRGFRSGLARPLVPSFVVLFIGIFLLVGGVLLCILHQTYVVARHDQLYAADNYFLISGVVALCLGIVVILVALGWCYHTHRQQADPIEDYKLRKGFSTHSLNHSRAGSFRSERGDRTHSEYGSEHPSQYSARDSRQYPNQYPPGQYPPGQYPGMHPSGHGSRIPSSIHGDSYYADQGNNSPRDDIAKRADKKFDDFRNFVNRNVEASRSGNSPRKQHVPYSDRLPPRTQGYADDDELARSRRAAEDADFDLARQYIQNPSKYYAQQEQQQDDRQGGYDTRPGADPRAQPRSRGQQGMPPPLARSSTYGAEKNRPSMNPAQGSNMYPQQQDSQPQQQQPPQPGNDPNNQGAIPTPAYRYDKGRPSTHNRSSSSHDTSYDSQASSNAAAGDTIVSMAPTGAVSPPAPLPQGVREKATLVYNPKDGQWYYYYKGKPISKYDPHAMKAEGHNGPVYKYIHGKPVLLPPMPPQQPKQV